MQSYSFSVGLACGLLAASALVAQTFDRPEPKAGFAYSEDYCLNRGLRVALHETSCLVVDGKTVLASCEMALNNPVWRTNGESCDPNAYRESAPASKSPETSTYPFLQGPTLHP